jgi:peptide deformylase
MSKKILDIAQLGNPVLRQSAQPIDNPLNPALQVLIDELQKIMIQSAGVGIAAPQVGISQRLIIVASRPTLRYPTAPKMPPTAMLNPQLVAHTQDTEKSWEGCLSVPGIRGLVPRFTTVTVAYLDRTGQPQQQILEGFVARVFQHEYDHLHGIVFIDHVEHTTELMSEQEYLRQIVGTGSSA